MTVNYSAVEPQLSDIEVIERVKAGETGLFELIMRRYNQRLFRVVRSILNDDAETEEVMQEAYVRAYEHLRQFEERSKFSTWLTKIAIYEAYARIRGRRKIAQSDDYLEDLIASNERSPEEQAFDGEMRSFIENAVNSLPPEYRTVLMMRDVEGLSTTETAECLDITEENVKVRLFRARAAMRRQLLERAGTASSEAFLFLGSRCDRLVKSVLARITAP